MIKEYFHLCCWIEEEALVRNGMLGQHAITSIMPTFFMDEADCLREDRPRLDFVVSFDDGQAVRYHPRAKPIWVPVFGSNRAIVIRVNRLDKLRSECG